MEDIWEREVGWTGTFGIEVSRHFMAVGRVACLLVGGGQVGGWWQGRVFIWVDDEVCSDGMLSMEGELRE